MCLKPEAFVANEVAYLIIMDIQTTYNMIEYKRIDASFKLSNEELEKKVPLNEN